MWSSKFSKLTFRPKDGDKVFVEGEITIYEAGGIYQIRVNKISITGTGELYAKYVKKGFGCTWLF